MAQVIKLAKREFYFLSIFLSKFKCFQGNRNTIRRRVIRARDIMLYAVRVVEKKDLDKYFSFEEKEDLDIKLTRHFSQLNTKRGQNVLKAFYAEVKPNVLKSMQKAADSIFNIVTKNSYMYKLSISTEKIEDHVDGNYVASNVGFCYFWDTTSRGVIHVTFLQDACSKVIEPYIITIGRPTGDDLVNLLQRAFWNKDPNRERELILHGDQAGENTCNEVMEFCLEKNIKQSFCDPHRFGNQVIERYNLTLWEYTYQMSYIADKNCEFGFDEQDENGKIAFIEHGILAINTTISHSDLVLPNGTTPLMLQEAMEIHTISKDILTTPLSEDGIRIMRFKNLAVMLTKQAELVRKINASGNPFQLKLPEEVKNTITDISNVTIAELDQHTADTVITNDILFELVTTEIKPGESPLTVRDAVLKKHGIKLTPQIKDDLQYAMSNMQGRGIMTILLKQREAEKREKESSDRLKRVEEILVEKNRKEEEIIRRKEMKKAQRKLYEQKARNPKYGLFWGDYKLIRPSITAKSFFIMARDRVAHFFLKATGMRVGNLRYLTWFQIERFAKGKAMSIIPIKSKNKSDRLVFPYYPGLKKFMRELSEEFKALRIYAAEVRAKYPEMHPDTSEFWSNTGESSIKIHGATKRMNAQLKAVQNSLKTVSNGLIRKVTTHSYRHGVAIVCNAFFGIEKTQKLLHHVSIMSTLRYLAYQLQIPQLIEIFEKGFSVDSYESLPLYNPDNLSRAEYIKGAIEAVENEERDARKAMNFPDDFGDEDFLDFK
jgi:transposase InsO family protein